MPTLGDLLLGRQSGGLLDLMKQYGAGVKQRVGLLADDPAEFTRQALLDVVPNRAEAQAAQARLMGGSLDPQAYSGYLGKMQDLGGLLGSIRVYHGSPHKFDKFDLSKIGTGEGAQMYGHGGYVAEAPDVAQNYIPRDAKFENNVMRMYKQAERAGDYDAMAVYERYLLHDTPSAVEQYVKEAASGGGDARKLQQANEAAKRLWERQQAGYLYEANLRWPDAAREAADPLGPQHFLDWDKPLSEQPAAVRDSIVKAFDEIFAGNGAANYEGAVRQGMTVGEVINHLGGRGPKSGEMAARNAADLYKAGIPGIRYLDAGSRGTGQGTSNYVVFDDNLIDILTRNGVPIK